jgi:hypothetical protein
MIHDFFEHLRLSFGMCKTLLENGEVDPEVREQVKKFTTEYDCTLLPDYELDTQGLTAEEAAKAEELFPAFILSTVSVAYDILGSAMNIYVGDALRCAASGEPWTKSVPGRQLLDEVGETE